MMHDRHLNSEHMGEELELLSVTQAIQNKIGNLCSYGKFKQMPDGH